LDQQPLESPPLADLVAAINEAAAADLWTTIGPVDSPDAALEALLDTLPPIVDKYGLAAGAVSADWYENDREAHLIPGRFNAVVPDMGDTGTEELARWAVTPLYQDVPDWQAAQSRTEGGLQRRVANHSRQTIMSSAVADPKSRGWQRVTSPAGGCGFCTMLASRGVVYRTEFAADFGAHDWCSCTAASAWEGREKPVLPYKPSKHQATDAERARTRAWIKKNLPGVEASHHARSRQ
jgi:hypothetical protein